MSSVTNVMLQVDILEDDEGYPLIEKYINPWLTENHHTKLCRAIAPDGEKALEATLYVQAFNYLDQDAFVKLVHSVPWQEPANVRLWIQMQDDIVFDLWLAGRQILLTHDSVSAG